MKLKGLAVLISIVCCVGLSACSLLGPVKTPEIHTYALTTQSATTQPTRHRQGVLLVSAPSAASGYQSSDMLYSLHPYQVSSFANNRWVAPPAEMLAPLIQQRLQASGCFRAVVTPPFSGTADVILDTQLLQLQQEFLTQGSRVRMAVAVTLSDTVSRQVVAARRFATSVPVLANDPYAGVVAANRATQILLNDIKDFVCKGQGVKP